MDKFDTARLHDIILDTINLKMVKSKEFIIAANWKMNKNLKEVILFIEELKKLQYSRKNKLILFPPFPYVILLRELLRGTEISYGFQNIHWEASGAFTGEVSPVMAADLNCEFVIIGHSERRSIFSETEDMVKKKICSAFDHNITPILCVGENSEERRENRFKDEIRQQLYSALGDIDFKRIRKLMIAYEPVWAIGTGLNASPGQIKEIHAYIKSILSGLFGEETAKDIPVLYGGSVNTKNVKDIAAVENVSGFLVGGASLQFEQFSQIIKSLG